MRFHHDGAFGDELAERRGGSLAGVTPAPRASARALRRIGSRDELGLRHLGGGRFPDRVAKRDERGRELRVRVAAELLLGLDHGLLYGRA